MTQRKGIGVDKLVLECIRDSVGLPANITPDPVRLVLHLAGRCPRRELLIVKLIPLSNRPLRCVHAQIVEESDGFRVSLTHVALAEQRIVGSRVEGHVLTLQRHPRSSRFAACGCALARGSDQACGEHGGRADPVATSIDLRSSHSAREISPTT